MPADAVYPHHITERQLGQEPSTNLPQETIRELQIESKTTAMESEASTALSPQPNTNKENEPIPAATVTASPPASTPPSHESIVREAMRYLSPPNMISSKAFISTGNPFVGTVGSEKHEFSGYTTTSTTTAMTQRDGNNGIPRPESLLVSPPNARNGGGAYFHHHDHSAMNHHNIWRPHHRPNDSAVTTATLHDITAIASMTSASIHASTAPQRGDGEGKEGQGEEQADGDDNGNENNDNNHDTSVTAAAALAMSKDPLFASPRRDKVVQYTNAVFPCLTLLSMIQGEQFYQRQQAAYYAALLDSDNDDDDNGEQQNYYHKNRSSNNNNTGKFYFDDSSLRLTAISQIIRSTRKKEQDHRLDVLNSNLYRRGMVDLSRKQESIQTTLQKREEQTKLECTFKPVISQHAMAKKALDAKPRGPLEFFEGGNQWMKEKGKRLEKKIAKRDADQAELDEVNFKPWEINKKSVKLLKEKEDAIRRAEAGGLIRKGTLEAVYEWRKLNPAAKHHFPNSKEIENVLIDPDELGSSDDDVISGKKKDPNELADLDAIVATEDKLLGNLYGYYDEKAVNAVAEMKAAKRLAKGDDYDVLATSSDDDDDDDADKIERQFLKLIKEDLTLDDKTRRFLQIRHSSLRNKVRKVTALERYIRADKETPYWAEECHFRPTVTEKSTALAASKWKVTHKDDPNVSAVAVPDVATRLSMDAREREERAKELARQKQLEDEMERLRQKGKTGQGPQRTPEEAEAYARKLMTGRTTSDYLRSVEDERAAEIKKKWADDRAQQQRSKIVKELMSTEAQLTFLLEAAEDPDCDLIELAKALPGAKKIGAQMMAKENGGADDSSNYIDSPKAFQLRGKSQSPLRRRKAKDDKIDVDRIDDLTLLSSLTPRGVRVHSTPKRSIVPIYATSAPPMPDDVAPDVSGNDAPLNIGTGVGMTASLAVDTMMMPMNNKLTTTSSIHRTLTPSVIPNESTTYDFRRESPRYLKAVGEMYDGTRFTPQTDRLNAYSGSMNEGSNIVTAANYRSAKNQKKREEIAEEIANDRLQLLRKERLSKETQQNQLDRLRQHDLRKQMDLSRMVEEKEFVRSQQCTFKPQVNPKSAQLIAEKEQRMEAEVKALRAQLGQQQQQQEQQQYRRHDSSQRGGGGVSSPSRLSVQRGSTPTRGGGGGGGTPSRQRVGDNFSPQPRQSAIIRRGGAVAVGPTSSSQCRQNSPLVATGHLAKASVNTTAASGPSARWSSPATRERYQKELSQQRDRAADASIAAAEAERRGRVISAAAGGFGGGGNGRFSATYSPLRGSDHCSSSSVAIGSGGTNSPMRRPAPVVAMANYNSTLGLGGGSAALTTTAIRRGGGGEGPLTNPTPNATSAASAAYPTSPLVERQRRGAVEHDQSANPNRDNTTTMASLSSQQQKSNNNNNNNDTNYAFNAALANAVNGTTNSLIRNNNSDDNNNNAHNHGYDHNGMTKRGDNLTAAHGGGGGGGPPFAAAVHSDIARRSDPSSSLIAADGLSFTSVDRQRMEGQQLRRQEEEEEAKRQRIAALREKKEQRQNQRATAAAGAVGPTFTIPVKRSAQPPPTVLRAPPPQTTTAKPAAAASGDYDDDLLLDLNENGDDSSNIMSLIQQMVADGEAEEARYMQRKEEKQRQKAMMRSGGHHYDPTTTTVIPAETDSIQRPRQNETKSKDIFDDIDSILKGKEDDPRRNDQNRRTSACDSAPTMATLSQQNPPPPPLRISKSELELATKILAAATNGGDDENSYGAASHSNGGDEVTQQLVSDLREWFLHLAHLKWATLPSLSVLQQSSGDGGNAQPSLLRKLLQCNASPASPSSSLSPMRVRRSAANNHHVSPSSAFHSPPRNTTFSGNNPDASSMNSPLYKLLDHPHHRIQQPFNGTFGSYVSLYGEEDLSLYSAEYSAAVVVLEVAHAALVVAMRVSGEEEEGGDDAGSTLVSDEELVQCVVEASSSSSSNSTVLLPLSDARVMFPKGVLTFDKFAELFIKMYGMG